MTEAIQEKDYEKNSRWKDVPATVMIELTNSCNFFCEMCTNPSMKRKKGFMALETFKKALERCMEADISSIKLYTTGESLLHPDFIEFWKLAVSYPFESVMISTNGALLKKDLIQELVKSKKLRIQFSFSGWDKFSYEVRYKPGKFEDSVETLKLLKSMIKSAGLPNGTLNINGITSRNKGSIEKCRNFLKKELLFEDDQIDIHHVNNWKFIIDKSAPGKVPKPKYSDIEKYYCHIANNRMGILYDGRVSACGCVDLNGELIIGNIFDNSIKEIRAGKQFSLFKDKFSKGNISDLICSRCDSLKIIKKKLI